MSNMSILNETHNPALSSWLVTANEANTDFPIQNLPFAVFKRANINEAFRGGVAIDHGYPMSIHKPRLSFSTWKLTAN